MIGDDFDLLYSPTLSTSYEPL